MAKIAQKCRWAKKLKLKLDSNDVAEKLFSVRNARPDADLIIDANTSWSPTLLDKIADVLASAKVELLEQPLPTTDDSFLKDLALQKQLEKEKKRELILEKRLAKKAKQEELQI